MFETAWAIHVGRRDAFHRSMSQGSHRRFRGGPVMALRMWTLWAINWGESGHV